MKSKDFFKLFSEGARKISGNPLMIVGSLLLGVILFVISELGEKLAINFQTTLSNILWTAFFSLVFLVLVSYFIAGLIGMALKSVKGEVKWKDFSSNANRFWFKNFQVMLLIVIVSILIGRIAHYVAMFIGRMAGLSLEAALLLFVLIYFAGLIGVLIFFTFSSFLLVKENLKVRKSVRRSFALVRREYLATLSLTIILFVIYYLLGWIPGIVGDVVVYGLALPYFVWILTKFVVSIK
ncbi:MAG: hypothetical protein ABIH92_02075, partial [Nanoarchaeota archaeon]